MKVIMEIVSLKSGDKFVTYKISGNGCHPGPLSIISFITVDLSCFIARQVAQDTREYMHGSSQGMLLASLLHKARKKTTTCFTQRMGWAHCPMNLTRH